MKLKTENYKGISIQVVKSITGGSTSNEVLARFKVSGKGYEFKGYTKDSAVSKAKVAIDRIL